MAFVEEESESDDEGEEEEEEKDEAGVGEEDLGEPGDEADTMQLFGGFLYGAWKEGRAGLRRRGTAGQHLEAQGSGAGTLDGDFFALGSERLDEGPAVAEPAESGVLPSCSRLLLVLAPFVVIVAIAAALVPSEASFREMRAARYNDSQAATMDGAQDSGDVDMWLIATTDRSFQGRMAWSRYVDHGTFALASVALSVSMGPDSKTKGKSKPVPRKVYEHRYLGAFGLWIPLPYLPQPGNRPGTFGVGFCVLGRCVCLPSSRKSKANKKGGKPGCWRFQSGKSAALNVMAVPNGVLFFLWQWPGYWSRLAAHTTLSLANLWRGRLWVLLAAPFSHRGWGEAFRNGVLLATTLDSFDKAGASFAIYVLLYLGGSWAAWLVRGPLLSRIWRGDKNAFYHQDWGASGGLGALLLFMALARPEERFQFSLYMIPVPVELTAWQSLFAHALFDLFMPRSGARGGVLSESLSHLGSGVFGWAVHNAWSKHT